MDEIKKLQYVYLEEAEQLFGPKTEYQYGGLSYRRARPRVVLSEKHLIMGEKVFIIELDSMSINDRKEGIFQLSHEVVHLLSRVEQDEENEVNYLEEGMATYFSRIITERETGDAAYCDAAIGKEATYLEAYTLYLQLISVDEYAVRKLREYCPVIANIQKAHFRQAGLQVRDELIDCLLLKF